MFAIPVNPFLVNEAAEALSLMALEREHRSNTAAALLARKQRWFIWARRRLRLALADAGSVRFLGEVYLPYDQVLGLRGLRSDGTPVRVKIRHRADFQLPSDLAASEREGT